jgi:hypothetical protein
MDIRAELAELCAAHSALHQRLLERIAAFDCSGAWRTDGSASLSGWLVANHGIGHRTAAEWVRVAHVLEELPALKARYAAGEISWDQLRATTRFADAETDERLAEEAPERSASSLQREARRSKHLDLDTLEQAHRGRFLNWWWDEDRRTFHLDGRLPDTEGAVVAKALGRIINRSPHEPNSGIFEDYEVRAADALVQLASESIGADRDPDRATVVVHVEAGSLASGHGVAEVAEGPAIGIESVLRFSCDARWQVAAAQGDTTVGIGRLSRSVPPWLHRTVHRRDRGCRFPGCERTKWVHVHHLVHWARGGPTDLGNLITLCGYHHRLVHEGGWRILGDPNGEIEWLDRFGHAWQRPERMARPRVPMRLEGLLPHHLQSQARRSSIDTS